MKKSPSGNSESTSAPEAKRLYSFFTLSHILTFTNGATRLAASLANSQLARADAHTGYWAKELNVNNDTAFQFQPPPRTVRGEWVAINGSDDLDVFLKTGPYGRGTQNLQVHHLTHRADASKLLDLLSWCPNLVQLEMTYCRLLFEGSGFRFLYIDPEQMKEFASFISRSHLEKLTFWGNGVDHRLDLLSAGLPPSLRVLEICADFIDDSTINDLAKYLPMTQLTTLSLGRNFFQKKGACILAPQLPKTLKKLILNSNWIYDEGTIAIAKILPDSQIETLDLSRCGIGIEGAEALFSALPKCHVTSLFLDYNDQIKSAGGRALATALAVGRITTLTMSVCGLRSEEFRALSAVLSESQLRVLGLIGNRFSDGDIQKFARALPDTLESLNLYGDDIRDAGAIALSEWIRLQGGRLKKLDVGFSGMSDRGAKAIASVLADSALLELNLEHQRIGNKGLESLVAALSESVLESLILKGNQIGNSGVEALTEVLPICRLKTLDLSFNKIGSRGALCLAALLPHCSMENLNLSCNTISDSGAQAIAEALPMSRIRYLDLKSIGISPRMEAQLKAVAKPLGIKLVLNEDYLYSLLHDDDPPPPFPGHRRPPRLHRCTIL